MRRNKYRVSPKEQRTWRGKVYPSKLEMSWAQKLDLMLTAGEVVKVEEQVPYPIHMDGKKICSYIPDFRVTYPDGRVEIWDAKGIATPIFRLKAKMMAVAYPDLPLVIVR